MVDGVVSGEDMADLHELGLDALPDPERDGFAVWLAGTEWSRRTRMTYLERTGNYLRWVRGTDAFPDALTSATSRDAAVAAYCEYLVNERAVVARTLNTTLAALDAFYDGWRKLGSPSAVRVAVDTVDKRTLDAAQTSRLFAEAAADPRDYALVTLLSGAGPLESELAALDVDDVELGACEGSVRITGPDGHVRVVPLDAGCRAVLLAWRATRRAVLGPHAARQKALFISKRGNRLAVRSVDYLVRSIGRRADLEISPGTLRNTAKQKLLVAGHSPDAVAALMGIRTLDTAQVRALTQLTFDLEI